MSKKRRNRRPRSGFSSFLRSLLTGVALLLLLYGLRDGQLLEKLKQQASPASPGPGLALHMIDVGQGQALLLTCGEDAFMVDAGLSGSAKEMIDYIQAQGVARLDYLFITHPHADHCGGAKKLLAAIPTDTLAVPDYFEEDALLATAGEWIGDTSTQIDVTGAGREYALGDATVTVLHPAMDNDIDDMNSLSLVLKVEYCGKTMLLTGDIPKSVEIELLPIGKIDLLLSPHHGSGGSNCQAFLEDLRPGYTFISCGKNNEYGHPHPETLERLEQVSSRVYRTDELGTVVFRVNEGEITVVPAA